MTPEQAIKFCLDKAEEYYKSADNYIRGDYPDYEATFCYRAAHEYEEMAELLKELKTRREACQNEPI